MPYEFITRLLGFPGFRIVGIEMQERSVVMTIDRVRRPSSAALAVKRAFPGMITACRRCNIFCYGNTRQ
ncbi:MAG: hypothetical protein D084_Lepto4C00422G0005 [Leptospirillum sp. Group IV 'UBA BS']|nr:MAG: hypothetical protein D084_Lepto4C00422G0005 [Leptospirillum sp. Group IV 'UBA BS']